MKMPTDPNWFRLWQEGPMDDVPPADVQVVTSHGRSISAHATVLASASPVLERMLERSRARRNSGRVIAILGVPCDAAVAFIQMLYNYRYRSAAEVEEEVGRYGVHLLAMAHKYRVGWLKRECEERLAAGLRAEEAVDVLKLARVCDAPRLALKCMRLVDRELETVQSSDGWRFMQSHDPRLELEILHFIQEADLRRKWRRRKEEFETYLQLAEAMECLQHICTEGCTDVGPCDGVSPSKNRGPCTSFAVCEGLQLLIRHFAACSKKLAPGGCPHCKRMWQLFRLHSDLCDQAEPCKVPLCKQFKMKKKMEEKEEMRWRLLVRKVISAKVMVFLAKRRRHYHEHQRPLRRNGVMQEQLFKPARIR